VGHSYGGVVVSEAGTNEKVKAVVYIAAFAPDKGESVSSLIANPPAGAPVPPILPQVDGFLFSTRPNLRTPSLRMSMPKPRHSWPTHRFLGAWKL
jgi:pimeloyl-ACP methyl ester carboxylesterase